MVIFVPGAVAGKALSKIPAVAKLVNTLKKVEKIIPDNVAGKLRKTEKVSEAAAPVATITKKTADALLAPYKKLRGKLDEVQRKLGNKNYTIFEEQLRKLPDDVLRKLDDNPDLLEAFAKRSLDDPDFYKAVQKGDLKELEELSKDPQTGKTDLNSISEANSILKAEKIGYIENPKRPNLKSGDPNIDFKIDGPKPFNWADIKTPIKPNKYQSAIDQATNIAKKIYDSDVMVIVDLKNLTKVEKKEVMEYILKYGKASKYNFLNY